uniref:Uncharacterized protein n=1 Tax=Rhizophora mucronata TaxID=61149 RepID=A0A2P2INE2_RHIMU
MMCNCQTKVAPAVAFVPHVVVFMAS